MDKEYIVNQLANLARKTGLDIGEEILNEVVGFSKFKVYSKGELLACSGDDASYAGIVMNGVVRSYYLDGDGNISPNFEHQLHHSTDSTSACCCSDSGDSPSVRQRIGLIKRLMQNTSCTLPLPATVLSRSDCG